MGKYMRKSKMTGEVAVMEVSQSSIGVRTRAKTLAIHNSEPADLISSKSCCYLQLRSRRLLKPIITTDAKKPKEPSSCDCNPNTRVVSDSLNSASVGSLSKSTRSKEEGFAQNEVCVETSFGENFFEIEGRDRSARETTPSSLIRNSETLRTPGSTTRSSNPSTINRRMQNITNRDIPTSREMEEFFLGAEQLQQRIFIEKYNYDPRSDLPLPGRYEWVRLDQ